MADQYAKPEDDHSHDHELHPEHAIAWGLAVIEVGQPFPLPPLSMPGNLRLTAARTVAFSAAVPCWLTRASAFLA